MRLPPILRGRLLPVLLVGLSACQPEATQTPVSSLSQYQDAEAVYMALVAGETVEQAAAPLRVTGRIQQLAQRVDTFPWLLHLKALSEQETLAVEVTGVASCQNPKDLACQARQGEALLRGQRLFLRCEHARRTPQPQLLTCVLSTQRQDAESETHPAGSPN